MTRRLVYSVAVLVLGVALVGLGAASRDTAHERVVLPDGVPAVVWEPGPTRGLWDAADPEGSRPVVVLAHGLGGNSGAVSALARRLARAGYAVVAFDLRGHGRHARAFDGVSPRARSGLLDDLDSAVLWAQMQRAYAGDRVAVVGYSLGASLALQYAMEREPVAAVVAISGVHPPVGLFPPPSTLLLWGEHDPDALVAQMREAGAEMTGLSQLLVGRTYGNVSRGRTVRLEQVPGVDHLTVAWSARTAERVVDWLEATIGQGVGARPAGAAVGDPRQQWALVGLGAALVLFHGLLPAAKSWWPQGAPEEPSRPLHQIVWTVAALGAAVVLLAGIDPVLSQGPLAFLQVGPGRGLFLLLACAGGLRLASLGATGRLAGARFSDPRVWAAVAGLFACGYGLGVVLAAPFSDMALSPHRSSGWLLGTGLLLPWFASVEWGLRGSGRASRWLALTAHGVALGVVTAATWLGVLPAVLLLALGPLALLLLGLERVGRRIARVAPNPWLAAGVQAAYASWILVAAFPFGG